MLFGGLLRRFQQPLCLVTHCFQETIVNQVKQIMSFRETIDVFYRVRCYFPNHGESQIKLFFCLLNYLSAEYTIHWRFSFELGRTSDEF